MIRIHQLLIGLIVAICLVCQIQAEVKYNITTADFDSRYATDPYNPSLSFQLGAQRQAIFYQIVTNVKNATFVALPDINLHDNGFNVPWPSFLYKYKGGTGGVESTGQVVDPCTFGSQDSTALLTVNATTDAEEGSITSVVGALDIPWIQNATTFEYTNPQVIPAPGVQYNSFVPSRFYRVNFNVSENETWHLEILSTEAVHIAVAGLGNCPSFKYNNDSAHWSENVPANQAVNTPVIAIKDKSIFWVQVLSEVSANVTFTWKLASSNAPGNPVLDLPTWATALLIVFGVVIVVLVIVVIVMCVKNRHRASYNTV